MTFFSIKSIYFYILKHVAKTTHSWIVEQNQMNCRNKNCRTSQRSPLNGLAKVPESNIMIWLILFSVITLSVYCENIERDIDDTDDKLQRT